ncbi:17535_t:CDS:2, partial [Gigaspora rosea]
MFSNLKLIPIPGAHNFWGLIILDIRIRIGFPITLYPSFLILILFNDDIQVSFIYPVSREPNFPMYKPSGLM